MKRTLILLTAMLLGGPAWAQGGQGNGTKALNWTNVTSTFVVNDIKGNPVDMQAWLDSGYCVVVDYSATWCYPCYMVHTSGILEDLYYTYGPNGQNRLRIVWVEIQGASLNSLQNSSFGDWTRDANGNEVPYPIVSNTNYISICMTQFDNAIPYITFIDPDGKYCPIYNEEPDVIIDPGDVAGTRARVGALIAERTGNPVGIEERDTPDVSLYPNPTSGLLHIDGSVTKAEVVDLNGRVLQSTTGNQIDLGNLPKGMYLVRLTTAKGVQIKKIIRD